MDHLIFAGYKIGNPAGNDHVITANVGNRFLIKYLHQGMTIFIIQSGQKNNKLIASGTIHRAVGKQIADQLTCRKDILITGFVAICIVDIFQSI